MTVIWVIIAIFALVLIAWMWNSLGNIEKTTKIACIIGGIIIVYILTFIIFGISKIGITYENVTVMKTIRTVFVLIFTIINGCVLLPYSFRKLDQINNEEIEKERFVRSIIILAIIIVILFIFESYHLGNIQQGILKMIK